MEATKKTSVTKAALLVVAALSMLLSGLFVATASRSDASPPAACPDGFNLTADGKNCFQNAVVTSADNPNTCAEGLLTPDGSKCYIAARLIPQEGTTSCPKGYSPDDSLGGMCARFEAADQQDDGCPEGARGVAGGCYILVAKGPAGALTCAAGFTLTGDVCRALAAAPTRADGTCPTADDIVQDGCYRVFDKTPVTNNCISPYSVSLGECKVSHDKDGKTDAQILAYTCPAGPSGVTVNMSTSALAGGTKIEACFYTLVTSGGQCPSNTDNVGGECRSAVAVTPGALACAGGAALEGTSCYDYAPATVAPASCPSGTWADAADNCRKNVTDAAGAYYCKDASAALNGTNCVYTAPFTVEKAPDAYKCDKGDRAVIGDQVLCFLGDADANLTSGPSCLQGVLSTDNLYCIVPRIDTAPAAVAAPVPSFTG